jgi:hypothetical protein
VPTKKAHNHASNRENGILHNGLFESNPALGAFFGQESFISGQLMKGISRELRYIAFLQKIHGRPYSLPSPIQ